MTEKIIMGNEAIALGAIAAGVKVVSGYPGTPSTEIVEALLNEEGHDVKVQWSTNEKVALEVAAGVAYTGARAMVTMKQVGLNVASDPLMCLSYIGVEGGLVVAVADDPGPWSSQTEQDTRSFARHANLPVYDPSSPEEAYQMVQDAFELSEEFKLPVIVRPTTRVCHASSTVTLNDERKDIEPAGFEKKPDWCIFPALSYVKHGELEIKQKELARKFDKSSFNEITHGSRKGIAVSGVSYLYVKEFLKEFNLDLSLFKIGTPYPLPSALAEEFISSVDSILVVEELDPIVEEQLLILSGGRVPIYGKNSGHTSYNGEFSFDTVKKSIFKYLGIQAEEENSLSEELPQLPVRPPVLCGGCPHRASFYAAKLATKDLEKVVYCGDIGCYTLGNAAPLNMVDTCLCMGAGITIAQGLSLAEPETKCLAFIGDSTFFHTGIPGVINAVYENSNITIVVLDNLTTAMTGCQPHPGTGSTAMGAPSKNIDIAGILKACGVEHIYKVNPFDFNESVEVFKKAISHDEPSAIIAVAPCISLIKTPPTVHRVDENCIACLRCINELGCPAMTPDENGYVVINELTCTDCGLCTYVCPVNAIKRGERNV